MARKCLRHNCRTVLKKLSCFKKRNSKNWRVLSGLSLGWISLFFWSWISSGCWKSAKSMLGLSIRQRSAPLVPVFRYHRLKVTVVLSLDQFVINVAQFIYSNVTLYLFYLQRYSEYLQHSERDSYTWVLITWERNLDIKLTPLITVVMDELSVCRAYRCLDVLVFFTPLYSFLTRSCFIFSADWTKSEFELCRIDRIRFPYAFKGGRGVVFLSPTLYSESASLHPDV